MRSWFLVAAFCFAAPCAAQQLPLQTESAGLVEFGHVRTEFGFGFYQRARYPLAGLEGDLTRIGIYGVRVGVGEYAEFQMYGVLQDFLLVTRREEPIIPPNFAGSATSDFGDLSLGAKLKMAAERRLRPALAFKFAVELPNARNESGLGKDETNFYASLLATKRLGAAELRSNVGLAILGSPVQPNSQADLLTYGLGAAVHLTPKVKLLGEIHGRHGPDRLGNENLSHGRLGIEVRAFGLDWMMLGAAGLKRFDPRSGFLFGVAYDFPAFNRKHGPATVK
jgi:hypothetical protein